MSGIWDLHSQVLPASVASREISLSASDDDSPLYALDQGLLGGCWKTFATHLAQQTTAPWSVAAPCTDQALLCCAPIVSSNVFWAAEDMLMPTDRCQGAQEKGSLQISLSFVY